MDNNLAKGRNSYDVAVGNTVVEFFNRNSTPYPVDVGGPHFDLVPVTQQKDTMLNAARLHAKQEYDRIMELVDVLQRQADALKRRLDITDWVHSAKYDFKLAHGRTYWLYHDSRHSVTRLSMHGPSDWFCGMPEEYTPLAQVQWCGDYTWIEVPHDTKK